MQEWSEILRWPCCWHFPREDSHKQNKHSLLDLGSSNYVQVFLELVHQCLPQDLSLSPKDPTETFPKPSSHLVAQKQPLDSSVDGLGVGFSTHLEGVFVWGQQVLAYLFQQSCVLH